MVQDPEASTSSGKRKSAPLSSSSLRRSKRGATANDGFKPASPMEAKTKSKSKKTFMLGKGKHQQSFSFSTDFPDIMAIDKLITLRLEHPQIPIHELQRMAKEVCGISPMEVAPEKLLDTEGPRPKGGAKDRQLVIYGSKS
jgi:hypothetical protein